MRLANKVLKRPDGQELCILAGKPIGDGKKHVYLLNPLGKEPLYTLWTIEFVDDEHFTMAPYEGENFDELKDELLDVFIENAHEVL